MTDLLASYRTPQGRCGAPQIALQVYMTEDHLVIVMEYASNGQLAERIDTSGRLDEDVARKLYQQLIDGMDYSHSQVGFILVRDPG